MKSVASQVHVDTMAYYSKLLGAGDCFINLPAIKEQAAFYVSITRSLISSSMAPDSGSTGSETF